jgi:hypothetical protein
MFDIFYSGVRPNQFAHERHADSIEHAQELSRTRYFWWINYLTDYTAFDFLFEPVPWEAEYTHTWPSQHHEYSGTFLVPRDNLNIQYRFHDQILPTRDNRSNYNQLRDNVIFDYTWCPHPFDPPYRYIFGNQWYPANRMPTVEYRVPGAREIKYILTPRAELKDNKDNNWTILIECEFDYSWVPDPGDPPYRYIFGNQWWPGVKMPTVEYLVPGATEIKYMPYPRARLLTKDNQDNWIIPADINVSTFDYSWVPDPGDPPLIYQFGTQWQKTGGPRYMIPGAQEIKYITTPRAVKTIKDNNWVIPDNVDNDSFDYTWHPDATEQPYIYQFGTQHQRTGGPQYHVEGATEIKYIDQIRIKTERVASAIYEIDHLDNNSGQIPDTVKVVRYFDNYLDTLRRLAKNIPDEHEFVWICSSVCDYTNFDFTWHPEVWQATMLHVFPSAGEKFGDTFFMHVPTFKFRAEKLKLLDWYDLNFMDKNVPRRSLPVVKHTHDTHVEAVKHLDFAGPLAVYTTEDIAIDTIPTVPLWREKTKTIVPLSEGASTVIVPKAAVPYIKRQLYDYPNIDRTQRHMLNDSLLDIVFIDNGEPNAEANYIYLKWAAERANTIKIHRSSGVSGRVAAYQAAAELSTTPWFFAVFAKLEVSSSFNWSWQPDRLQEPKHYIFHAYNPVNGLEYGHMSTIAYNKQLVLANTAEGLDFTLDQAHEVVPVLSGTANYHTDMWTCWRTAFRECIKLKDSLPNVENEYRLNQWLTKDNTEGQWSIKGATDAVEYYNAINGNFAELRKSYDWAWLNSYAMLKYGSMWNRP